MNCIHNKDEQEHCEECNCDKPQHTATPWKDETMLAIETALAQVEKG